MEGLARAAGHADRVTPLQLYCIGLLLPGERKSVEPMAARLAPENVRRMHQSLHHVVADAPWSDEDRTGAGAKLRVDGPAAASARGSLDCGRHRFSEERKAFGGRDAAILRTSGQARQLPGGGEFVCEHSHGQSADRLAFIFAAGMGRRPGSPRQNRSAGRNQLSDEARPCFGADTSCGGARMCRGRQC